MQRNGISWRNYSIGTKTRIAVLLPMTALLASCVLIGWVSSQQKEANQWVIHTFDVRLAIANLAQQLTVAELESDPKGPLTPARESVSRIQNLTSDNPSQQRRIPPLNSLLDRYASLRSASAATVGARERQTQLTGQIRRMVADMDQEEIRLLGGRTDRTNRLQTILSIAISGTLLVGIAGTLFGTALLSGNVSKRIGQLLESSILMREGVAVKSIDPSRDEIGQLASTLAQTSRVLTERAGEIAESNWKLESVLRAATSVAIVAEDLTGRVSLFSAGATRLLGYRTEEAMGRDLAAIVGNGSAEQRPTRRQAPAASAVKQQEPNEYETVYVRKDGLRLDVQVSMTPLKNVSGKVTGYLYVAQDITPRKLLEAELRKKIETRESGNQAQRVSNDDVQLPALLKPEGEADAELLSWNVSALNAWYESQGQIADPRREPREDAPRILIVDDFEPTRFLLRAYLQDEGYTLDFGTNGKEALERVAEHSYHLILMDVEMPEMDGYEAASRIRDWEKSQGRPPVPIVALSAHNPAGLGSASVWTSYLEKPISKQQLLEEIKSYIEVKAAA